MWLVKWAINYFYIPKFVSFKWNFRFKINLVNEFLTWHNSEFLNEFNFASYVKVGIVSIISAGNMYWLLIGCLNNTMTESSPVYLPISTFPNKLLCMFIYIKRVCSFDIMGHQGCHGWHM